MPNKPKPVFGIRPAKPVKPIVSPPAPLPPVPTDLQVVQTLAEATFAAAKMAPPYTIFDMPSYIACLVAKIPPTSPVEVPTDVKNDTGKLSMLVMLLTATMRAANMPAAQGNSNTHIYTMKDLPSWVASLLLSPQTL